MEADLGARARIWADVDGRHIDVRGLEPPEPLVAILELVDSGARTDIVVHHDRDPALLYDELPARGWAAEHVAGDAGEVRLRLSRL